MKSLRNEKGQSLVEFAILLPILLLLLMGILEFGIMLNSYLTINNSAREGARLGIVAGSDLEINQLIATISPNLDSGNIIVNITPSEGNRISGGTLTVEVIYNYQVTIPIISNILNDVVVLKAKTSMRIEWVWACSSEGDDIMRKLDEKGNVAIILCLVFTALLGFTAYVVDIGLIYVEKVKLSNAIDSAVLAGSLELPKDAIKAKSVAIEYLKMNDVDESKVLITISSDNKDIQIEGIKTVDHIFAPIIGINNSDINASTKAIIAPIKSVKGGVRPFAVEKFDFSYGDVVTLKQGAGDGYHGNYGAVALGGTGASVFKSNALYGYGGTITVGDMIDTETGNMTGATNEIKNYINSEVSSFNDFQRDSIRLWTIPLIDSLLIDGRKDVLVVGFGEFYVESIQNNSGKLEIIGRFIRYVRNGEIDITLSDTGAYGSKLVK